MSEYRTTTEYFRKALASQISPRIDLKNDSPYITDMKQIAVGEGFEEYYQQLFRENEKHRSKSEPEKTEFEILIALKTVLSPFDEGTRDSRQPDELTCVFFAPAKLRQGGILGRNEEKLPWFVREFLQPMVDPELCLGKAEDADQFLEQTTAERSKMQSWSDYWDYVCSMYQAVAHTDIFDLSIPNMPDIRFDDKCYLVRDNTVVASRSILKLYDAILSEKSIDSFPLYRNLIAIDEMPSEPTAKDSPELMKRHSGQMGCAYPLSDSQRESLNHLNMIAGGEILAVCGPPGTGKTTLLQSVVADLITKCALSRSAAPVIAASSTNNQAVTNIIDSFSQQKSQNPAGLDSRWITAANSFATYFPSASKKGKIKKYQTDDEMIRKLNQADVRAASRETLLQSFEKFFDRNADTVSDCKAVVYDELAANESLKCALLEKHGEMMALTDGLSASTFFQINDENTQEIKKTKAQFEQTKGTKLAHRQKLCERMEEWERSYHSQIPWFTRLFGFFSSFKNRIMRWTLTFKSADEIADAPSAQTPKEMLEFYQKIISIVDSDILELNQQISKCDNQIDHLKGIRKQVSDILDETVMVGNEIGRLTAYLPPQKNKEAVPIDRFIAESVMKEINEYVDTSLRWRSFWLAVHYYECEWLESEPLTEDELWKTTSTVLKKKYRQLAMLSPCFVMTFYMLPAKMKSYDDRFLKNYIDLLIVDEAGQTSPEVAAASFALAKKAIVVGDVYQIPPVWGVSPSLDIALAKECGVIESPEEFENLKKRGLNTSQSSVMKLALGACPYHKFDKGLFLSEHRRCYDEIIGYCNDLVYKGRLEPKRGSGLADEKRPDIMNSFPVIGYHDIAVAVSEKVGSSRKNITEAKAIAQWIQAHFDTLYNAYKAVDHKIEADEVITVITPFKAQASEIRKQLRGAFDSSSIPVDVGTVHTFQGAERRIVIFSTTYGANESGFFIDTNSNLMNVAVSRAKDAFWVFGSIECMKKGDPSSAKGLLYQYMKENALL